MKLFVSFAVIISMLSLSALAALDGLHVQLHRAYLGDDSKQEKAGVFHSSTNALQTVFMSTKPGSTRGG
jgi:hypothetical protein